ncbi:hypothetical protein NIES4103_06380 [Nostoc sp. NIES-4103]|nr:hypothetical protein NIES4103_06380 [Nostoc sp. NIES-4103]
MTILNNGYIYRMSTSEFDKYKVDHLFLLVGENPLPNYVAAKLLLKEGGKPYLVFSEGTEKPAERLQEALDLSDNETVFLDNNESNAYEIKTRIRKKIKELQKDFPEKKCFGLNYTGGTKAMAVHAYLALISPDEKDLNIQLNPPPVFSYLDSRNLKMLIEQSKNPEPLDIPSKPLELSLEKLFKLHGLTLSKPSKPDVTLRELVEAIVKNNLAWRNWCKNQLYIEGKEKEELAQVKKDNHTEIYFKFGNWKHHKQLINASFDITGLPEEIISIMRQKDMISPGEKLSVQHLKDLNILPKSSKNKKIPEEICKWLEGIWLEDYVLQQLNSIKEECLLDEVGMSFNFPEKYNITEFEFDVACLRGYQLFAISCTSSEDNSLCKSKLFEAYRRARQMGGDEARIALVCYYDKPEKIKQRFMSQIPDHRVNVFGSGDIADLSTKLRDWIQGVDE